MAHKRLQKGIQGTPGAQTGLKIQNLKKMWGTFLPCPLLPTPLIAVASL